MPSCNGCMNNNLPSFGDCKNRAEVCELEITGNLSTLRCNRFPGSTIGNNNNRNNFNGNNSNGTLNVSNLLPETVRTRYAQSADSIAAGNGANPRFYTRMSRTVED